MPSIYADYVLLLWEMFLILFLHVLEIGNVRVGKGEKGRSGDERGPRARAAISKSFVSSQPTISDHDGIKQSGGRDGDGLHPLTRSPFVCGLIYDSAVTSSEGT
jgi:hypothetical protein